MASLDRESAAAKEDAQRKLARYAAGILRTIAGSTYDVYSLRHSLADFLDAQKLLLSSRGSELTTKEEREALKLPRLDADLLSDRRRLIFETGNRLIVEGHCAWLRIRYSACALTLAEGTRNNSSSKASNFEKVDRILSR